jgi:PEGA domain
MGSRSSPVLTALLVAGPLLSATWAQSVTVRPVQVRPVQVREVRVNEPPSDHRKEQRPSFGVERPTELALISRPVPRPQPSASAPRHRNRHVRGTHPHYSFKPRFNTGFGVVVGYPVIYPYAYPYIDPFSPSSVASYTPAAPPRNTYSNVATSSSSETVTAAPPVAAAIECEGSACGGVSFEITPASAQVWVDGVFAGALEDFSAASAPLLLAPGDHYIEVRLAGYRTASLDVTIVAGEVTPYQGMLERLRLRRP